MPINTVWNLALLLSEVMASRRMNGSLVTAREIAQRTGVKAMLPGLIAGIGNQYVVTLDAVNAATGDTLAAVQAPGET